MQLHQIKQKAVPILLKHKIRKAALFGSYAMGEATEKSDIDILVDLSTKISLLDFIGIKLELEDELGVKVDLVEYNAVKPLLKEQILKYQIPII